MAKLIPYKRISINTALSKDELIVILSQALPPLVVRWYWPWQKVEGYWGSVDKRGFVFRRNITGTDSFLPSGFGRFVTNDHGTRVDIHIVAPAIVVFVPIIIFLGAISVTSMFAPFPFGLIALPFAIGFCVFFIQEFNDESPKAEQYIRTILDKYVVV